jgi:hypothetical protein
MKKRRKTESFKHELAPLLHDPHQLNLVLQCAHVRIKKERQKYYFDWRWYGIAALLSLICALAAPPHPVAWLGLLGGWLSVLININVVIRLFKKA